MSDKNIIHYGFFDPADGRILQSGTSNMPIQLAPNMVIGSVNAAENYVDPATKEILERPILPVSVNKTIMLADGVDEVVISGIPAGAMVVWPDSEMAQVDDGVASFSIDLAGIYAIQLILFPYKDWGVTIEATD